MKKSYIFSTIIVLFIGQVFVYLSEGEGWDLKGILTALSYFLISAAIYISLVFIIEKFKKKKSGTESFKLPETDERIQQNSVKFFAQVLALSHIIGAVIIVILMAMNQGTIQTEYVLYYIVAILFLTMTVGASIVRKL